jgi:lipoprotein-releasing system permease protein
VRGVREDGIKSLKIIADHVQSCTLDGFDAQGGLAIGTRLAEALQVRVGDMVTLVSSRGAATPFGTAPRIKPYKVSAIFEMGMSEYDRTMMFMPLAEAQRYFSKDNTVDVLEVLVDDPEAATATMDAMKAAGIPGLNFLDWRKRNQSFFTRARGRAQHDVHHPVGDRFVIRVPAAGEPLRLLHPFSRVAPPLRSSCAVLAVTRAS